jgi:hypothetical protein
MSYTIWADDRLLILDALNRQHDDLRRQAAGRSLIGEHNASVRRHHRERRTAQRSWPPSWHSCLTGITCCSADAR